MKIVPDLCSVDLLRLHFWVAWYGWRKVILTDFLFDSRLMRMTIFCITIFIFTIKPIKSVTMWPNKHVFSHVENRILTWWHLCSTTVLHCHTLYLQQKTAASCKLDNSSVNCAVCSVHSDEAVDKRRDISQMIYINILMMLIISPYRLR